MKNYQWQVKGHEKIKEFLQKGLDNDKLSHAYLFSGQAHLGKRMLADEFISTIFCQDYQRKNSLAESKLPCGQCAFCQEIKKGIHPDIYFLRKEDGKKNISVEQVREMHKSLSLASFLNSYKVALIECADDLSESAQNALLKMLEEPTPKTILILLTSDHNLLLPTIVSRCQLVKFYPLNSQIIYQHLIDLGANRNDANVFTSLAHGHIGLAIDFFEQPELFQEYLARTQQFLQLLGGTLADKFSLVESINSLFNDHSEAVSYWQTELDNWQVIFRDLLLAKNQLSQLVANTHFLAQLENLSGTISTQQLALSLRQIKLTKKYLNYNINPRLAVENLVLNF